MPFARSTTAAVLREVRLQIDGLSSRQIALLAAGCVATISVLVMLPEAWLQFMLRWAAPFAAMGCVQLLSWALRECRLFWCVRKEYRSKKTSEWIRSRSLSGRLTYKVLRLSGSVKKIEDLSHEGWRFLRRLHARGELVNELREKASARAAQESGTFRDVVLNFSVFKLLGSKRLCRVVSACVFVFFLPVTFWPLLLLDVDRACVKALEVVPLQRNFDARRSRDDLAADARAWKRGFVAARAEWRERVQRRLLGVLVAVGRLARRLGRAHRAAPRPRARRRGVRSPHHPVVAHAAAGGRGAAGEADEERGRPPLERGAPPGPPRDWDAPALAQRPDRDLVAVVAGQGVVPGVGGAPQEPRGGRAVRPSRRCGCSRSSSPATARCSSRRRCGRCRRSAPPSATRGTRRCALSPRSSLSAPRSRRGTFCSITNASASSIRSSPTRCTGGSPTPPASSSSRRRSSCCGRSSRSTGTGRGTGSGGRRSATRRTATSTRWSTSAST